MAGESPSKAIVPSASWNLSPTKKKSSGVEQPVGTISTRSALINGLWQNAGLEFVVYTGWSPNNESTVWSTTDRSSRSEWQFDNNPNDVNLEQLQKSGQVNHEGYVNVASELGLPILRGTRPSLYRTLPKNNRTVLTILDYSTYYRHWASPASYSYGQRSRGPYNSGRRTYRTYY